MSRRRRLFVACVSAVVALCFGVPGAGASTYSCANSPPCTMSSFGGPVMHAQRIVLVDWGTHVPSWITGSAYTSSNYLSAGDPGYVNSLAALDGSTADIGGVFAQYADPLGTGGGAVNAANHFSYVGQDVISSPSVGGGTTTATVDDTDIEAQLDASIHDGTLPTPTHADSVPVGTGPSTGLQTTYGVTTLYVVLMPPNDTITMGGSDSITGFCAYHNSFASSYLANTDIVYAVMPDNGGLYDAYGGCGPDTSVNADINNETEVLGHELGEAVTDPLIGLDTSYDYGYPAGWGSNNTDPYGNLYGEVGDVCATGTAQEQASAGTAGAQWISQALWSNVDAACATAEPAYSPPTAAITAPGAPAAGAGAGFSAVGSSDPAGNTIVSNNGLSLPSALGPGIASYAWSWGDGSSQSSGASPSHTYASPGSYTVTLTVTDDLGFTGTTSTSVNVGDGLPVPVTGSTSGVSGTGATLLGTVNPEGSSGVTYRFLYGTSPGSLDQQTASTAVAASSSPQQVSAMIAGLSKGATYYYELVASLSNVDYPSGVRSFTADSGSVSGSAPIVSTSAPSALGTGSATLAGTINPAGLSITHHFEWGTSAGSLTHLTGTVSGPAGTLARAVSSTISGLSPNHIYYYRAVANSSTTRYTGAVVQFRTRAVKPSVTVYGASAIRGGTAVVRGAVNPSGASTRYYFQFGSSRGYRYSSRLLTAGTGTRTRRVSARLGSLKPGRRYHYRLVAINSAGASYSHARTFRTARRARRLAKLSFSVPSGQRVGRALARGLAVRYRCSSSCRVTFSAMRFGTDGARGGAEPIQIAAASVRARSNRRQSVRLRLTAAGRRLLRGGHAQNLTVIGMVVDRRSSVMVPVSRPLLLRPGGR